MEEYFYCQYISNEENELIEQEMIRFISLGKMHGSFFILNDRRK